MHRLHNFADDNTISAIGKNVDELLSTLKTESEIAVDWFNKNSMIVNPNKFQALIVNRSNNSQNSYEIQIKNHSIKSDENVKLLGINIDNKLIFDEHVSQLCKKASAQLNAICRLSKFLGPVEKEIIINSFVYSNFNYCPLVWHFCSKSSLNKIEKIQEHCLRMIQNDYESDYNSLLRKSDCCTMEVRRLRTLALEIFCTLNNLNPKFMEDIFYRSPYATHKPQNIYNNSHKTAKYGDRSLRTLGPHIWNSLPNDVKTLTSFNRFKEYIKTWFGNQCKCNLCCFKAILRDGRRVSVLMH